MTRDVNDMSRAELIAELRRVAADLPRPVESRDLPQGLWRAARRTFGSMAKARQAAGLPDPPRNHRWSPERVIEEMQSLSRAGVLITEQDLRDAGRKDLLGAIGSYFGSIVRARRLARVPDPPYRNNERERWDEQRVVEEILARQRDGEPLAKTQTPTRLVKAGMRYFGSWQQAVEAAGLDYDEVRLQREPYTEEELLEMLRSLAAERPDMTLAEANRLPYHPALTRFFGSVEQAARRAGLDEWPERLREPALSAAEVIERLQARREEAKATYWDAVQSEDFHLWYSGMLQFGEWERAIAAAGLESDAPTRSWTRETLLDALRARRAQGLSLKPADIIHEDSALYFSARTYFGNYLAAVREIGDAPWALTRWTPELIVERLRTIAGGKERVTAREAGHTLVTASQNHFGSFSAACRAAGLVPNQPTRRSRP